MPKSNLELSLRQIQLSSTFDIELVSIFREEFVAHGRYFWDGENGQDIA